MGILRTDRVSGLGGANAITGSTHFAGDANTGNYLRVDTGLTEDFTFGTGDFTIEFWANSQGSGFQQHFYDGRGTTNSQRLLIYIDNNHTMYYFDGTATRIQSSSALPIGDWVHVALVRASATTKLYWNGTQTGSTHTSDTVDFLAPTHGSAFIGSNGGTDGIEPSGGGYFNGFLSNYRIVKGTAVYTANFTPPNTRLSAIDGTVLLTCTSSGNVSKTEGGNDVQPSAKNSNSTPPVASRFTPNSPVGFSTTTDVGSQYGSTFDGFGSFATSTYMVPPGGNTRERNRGRALYAGGYQTPNTITAIDSIEIQSGGVTKQFGDLSGTAQANCSACSSSTRMVTNGGWTGSANNNVMEFVTIANSSNSTDFGDLAVGRRNNISASNQTRGLVYGGNGSPANTAQVDFFTIATAGNAADFGDASSSTAILPAGGSSTTRALFAGGYTPSASDTIDYFTIASTGNATDFGNLTSARKAPGGLSSSTRTLFGGGGVPSAVKSIDFVTTATTGNATDFGDLFLARSIANGTSNQTRGIFMGGSTSPARQDTIDSVTIASTGNAVNWGDFTTAKQNGGVASDSHGGLS